MPLKYGAFMGSAGNGRIAAASRRDYADAAVAVLTQDGHRGKTYELAGDHGFTMNQLAAEVSIWAGRTIPYKDLPAAAYKQALTPSGLPPEIVDLLVGTDVAIARGDLDSSSRDLHTLIGRDTATLGAVLGRMSKP